MVKYNNIKANTKKADTIRASTIKAETITSSTPKKSQSAQASSAQAPQTSLSKPRAAQTRRSITSTPTAPPVPKQTTPSLSQLAHSPGAITLQKRSETPFKEVEDIITAQIVGNDFSTGQTKVRDGSGNIYDVQIGYQAFQPTFGGSQGRSASVVVGQQVIISRSRSQSGERVVRLISVVPLGQSPNDALSGLANNPNTNDLCVPSQNTSTAQNPKDEPEDPEDAEVPPPPTEPNPNEPEEEDPPSKPFGCNPTDDAQWYNGEICPAGLESLGFAILPNGSTKTLCRGPNRPPGDGCPESPDEYGWICVSGTCEFVPFGLYSTKAECENVCTNPEPENEEVPLFGYVCVSGTCVEETENPTFSTLAECNAARTPVYGPPDFTGGQCPTPARYSVSYQIRTRNSTFNSCGSWSSWGTVTTTVPADTLFGPITYPQQVIESNDSFPTLYDSGISFRFTANGIPFALNIGGSAGSLFASTCGPSVEFRNFSVTRLDGPADNCGDVQGPLIGYTC
jgi:hypothetical protein